MYTNPGLSKLANAGRVTRGVSRSEEGRGGLNTDPHQLTPQYLSIPLKGFEEKNAKKSWKKNSDAAGDLYVVW